MPTPSDEDALQRICEEVEAEMGVRLHGAVFLDFAKAVARRYATTVGAGVPEGARQKLVKVSGQLRHAYTHLHAERVREQREFADGLIAPQIRELEAITAPPSP